MELKVIKTEFQWDFLILKERRGPGSIRGMSYIREELGLILKGEKRQTCKREIENRTTI